MHKYLWIVVIALLWTAGSAMAQSPSLGYSPFLQRGTHELALSGTFDFQNEGDALLDLTGRYGVFLRDNLEVGGFAELSGDFDDFFRYGIGGFAELHIPRWAFLKGQAVPYLGADLGLEFVDVDPSVGSDNAALLFRLRPGLKWFIRDYFAIDTSFFFTIATDDLFPNEAHGLDPYDIGLRLGLRIYFK